VVKLVVLGKGGKPLNNLTSFGPKYLLNTVSELFERIVEKRIERHHELTERFNARQFGFRTWRPTEDAPLQVMKVDDAAPARPLYNRELCAVVALDVTNAFNTAKWHRIGNNSARKGRTVLFSRNYKELPEWTRELQCGGSDRKTLTFGAPRGSVLRQVTASPIEPRVRRSVPDGH